MLRITWASKAARPSAYIAASRGAIATRCLARSDSKRVLILGTGSQAVRQIESHLALIGGHLTFTVWGRSATKARAVVAAMEGEYAIAVADDLADAVRDADIIITATGAPSSLIAQEWVQPGTHITAVGADAPGKQELAPDLVAGADVLAVDSMDQCLDQGEVSHAFAAGQIQRADVIEVGQILSGAGQGRRTDSEITIADLTGIAAQDIAIANVVLDAHREASA